MGAEPATGFPMIRGAILPALLVLAHAPASAGGAAPANPKASAGARKVLRLLQALPKDGSRRAFWGQFIGYGGDASMKEVGLIYNKTRRWPSILAADYHDYKRQAAGDGANALLLAHWKSGGLVMVSNHAGNPVTGADCNDRRVDVAELLKPGTAAGKAWAKELDALAAGLGLLRNQGVVVLWRPFHEMNGDWFWWGGRDPKAFTALWRHMFERFSKAGLDNLLWVYSPDAKRAKVASYYPGPGYVDVVGLDAYATDLRTLPKQPYAELLALGKPFGFTEWGPAGKAPKIERTDNLKSLAALKDRFPKAAFFVAWNGPWGLHNHANLEAMLADPWLVSRKDSAPPGEEAPQPPPRRR